MAISLVEPRLVMSLPGTEWLRSRLAASDAVSGGYQAKMGHPVAGGAGFAMSGVFVLAGLLALLPLCLWSLGKRLVRAARRDPDSAGE